MDGGGREGGGGEERGREGAGKREGGSCMLEEGAGRWAMELGREGGESRIAVGLSCDDEILLSSAF